MEIKLRELVVWDDMKPISEQSTEAKAMFNEAMQKEPLSIVSEPCIDEYTRPIELVYSLTDQYVIKVNPIYINSATSNEFMGVADQTISIIPNNG